MRDGALLGDEVRSAFRLPAAQARGIRKAADRAATLTRQMLAFSRQELVKPREVDLNQVIAAMQHMLPRLLGEDIELVVQLGEGLEPVLADPIQLEQVVMNLAANARDAMPSGGVLHVRTQNVTLATSDKTTPSYVVPGEYVLLEVRDSGQGMAPGVLERVFEPFYTTKETGKGTGLGLAMVYGIVKQAGGYIVPESHPGKGARFRIYLPRLERSVRAAPAAVVEPGFGPVPSQRTVLLVEDQDDVRHVAAKALQRAGYTVLEASGGDEALLTVDRAGGTVDLLLTDVVMPGMNGWELAKAVEARCHGVRTLFMSGYTADEVMRHRIENNAVNFIQKPFTPQQLARKVNEMLKES